MWNAALSTMWGITRFSRFADFFAAGQAAGFTCFELNHGVNSAMLASAPLNDYRITSVHEPCPADLTPAELKQRGWLVSALDEADRQRGVEAVRRSIILAHQLGASTVIVHLGRVEMDETPEAQMQQLYRTGQHDTPAYQQHKAHMIAERGERASPHQAAVRRSLDELAGHAARLGVRLGLENRDHYYEIPLMDELDELLSAGYGATVGYWHDVGHAQKLEHMGYCLHEAWLIRFADKMIGVHLHDIAGMDDHLPAGRGTMPWDLVRRHLSADILRTCEFGDAHAPELVASGLQWLVDHGLTGQA